MSNDPNAWMVAPHAARCVLDANGGPVCVAETAEIAASIVAAHNSGTLAARRRAFTEEMAAAQARAPGTTEALVAASRVVQSMAQRQREYEAWEASHPLEADDMRAREGKRRADYEVSQRMREMQVLTDRAVARGCVVSDSVIRAALDPRDTPAMTAVRAALAWRKKHARGGVTQGAVVILSGDIGTGKSVGLVHVVATAQEDNATYTTASDVADLPVSDYGTYVEARRHMVVAPVISIDECGVEHAKRAGERVSGIVKRVYDRGGLVILATNLDREKFIARYFVDTTGNVDTRLVSRVDGEQKRAGLDAWWALPKGDMRANGGPL